jgi:HD-GYP domain-containing protein (c-di-GMP phosphodiesterase class II)
MRALARAVDAKDSGTHDHSERVARLAARLAVCDFWPDPRVRLIELAGYVHDVGKLGIPAEVLQAPRRLTPAERHQVELHPGAGFEMLASDEGRWTSEQLDWVRHHHERPDGKGYPDGLGLHDLSAGAQLLALADTWDVMTSTRPYKVAVGQDEALAEVRDLCGLQFTHRAVRALERLLGVL